MGSREEHTGIYVRRTTRAETPQDTATLLGQVFEKQNNRPLSTWLDDTQARAEAIRELEDVPDPVRRDAVDALGHCLSIRHCADAGEIAEALYEAYQLGMVVERIGVREWEQYAAAGVNSARPCKASNEKRRLDAEARHRRYAEAAENLRQAKSGITHEELCREVAKQFDVDKRTIARAIS